MNTVQGFVAVEQSDDFAPLYLAVNLQPTFLSRVDSLRLVLEHQSLRALQFEADDVSLTDLDGQKHAVLYATIFPEGLRLAFCEASSGETYFSDFILHHELKCDGDGPHYLGSMLNSDSDLRQELDDAVSYVEGGEEC
jgi:hypothetical protein